MIRNYFKIALRNIIRFPAYSILNIIGMAIGMACAILILLWVQDEWSYDRHFKNADNLYRLIEKQNLPGGKTEELALAPTPLVHILKQEYPEIIRTSRYAPVPLTLKKGNDFIEETVAAVDKDFLKMFDIEFVKGDIRTALDDPHNIILTEETAHKYFGDDDAYGKTIESRGYAVKVTGIVKVSPSNSHIRFNFITPFDWLNEFGLPQDQWWSRDRIYIELNKETPSEIVGRKIQDIIRKYDKNSNSELYLQNIKKIHLFSSRKYTYDVSGLGDINYVRILGIIAVFILGIACINFMNLSTAQYSRRAKEIGVRKIAGAKKQKIIVQFLGESLLIIFVAHIVAMILVELLLPGFNNLTGKQLIVNYKSTGLYFSLLAIVLFCGFLAGSYPAFYLSSYNPLNVIKGLISKNPGNTQFRRVLVIFQFSVSVLLIICTLVVFKQINYLQNENLGFNKDNLGYFMFPIRPGDGKLKTLKKELTKNPDIISVTIAHPNVFNNEGTREGFNWKGKTTNENVLFHFLSSDEDYAATFQLKLKEGRFFSSGCPSDASAVVINETAAKILGFKEPLGETIITPQGENLNIIGVVKDFHFQSLHYKIEPLIMQLGDDNNLIVKMKPEGMMSAVAFITKTYKSFDPGIPIDFHFLDDDFDNLYRAEQRMSKIFGYFSFLSILISCLGLIGLSLYMTERRTKEIGIRKAHGARSHEIFLFLSKEYLGWVLISIIIACPVAWYAMYRWMQNFAYRISISWGVFLLAGTISLVIALLTVSWQSYRAASRNPVDALRYE
jgi:putative ABC transport system permease protein